MRTLVPYFFLCLLLCCLCACGHGSYPAALHRADSLADACPDSARALLARWADSVAHAPERVRMYHALLTVKAADKAYVRHTSDTVIKDVVAYYEDGADPWLLPEAYYYAGRVYSDLGDAPQALDYFERAAEALPPKGCAAGVGLLRAGGGGPSPEGAGDAGREDLQPDGDVVRAPADARRSVGDVPPVVCG